MGSPNVKRVPIQLDKKRHIVLDLNAYCAAEQETGRNFMKAESWNELTFRDIRALLFAGLRKDDPSITIEQVGEWVHTGNLGEVSSALVGAFSDSMPEATPDAKGPLAPEISGIVKELDEMLTASTS